ncbi:MAG: hypothetical protein JW902_12495 [Syntrophaceae bacterium]|nr:hypothetical protein [Syntrophaceae bacterium]
MQRERQGQLFQNRSSIANWRKGIASQILDEILSKVALTSSNSSVAVANITSKKSYHSKTGYQYYIDYEFSLESRDYKRKWFYGLLSDKTAVSLTQYDSVDIGTDPEVLYNKENPNISRPRELVHETSRLQWKILGIIFFMVIGVNEIRNRRKAV